MANTRRQLKDYRGYTVVVQNSYKYLGSKDGVVIESNSLENLKRLIDRAIDNET